MANIADLVKLKTGYANFVNLKDSFEEAQENAGRMAMYRPTKAHRKAFERLCRGLYQPNDKKFYLLSGSYGTGKSHLCLMFANFLSRASVDPEIRGFYENYERLSPDMARTLRNIRKDGQYLVAICDFYSGRNFEDVVLKAVLEASERQGLGAVVQTEFSEAERVLAEWKEKGKKGGVRDFFADFGQALGRVSPGLSVEQLLTGLRDCDSEALEHFRLAFREAMGGLEFQAKSGNLVPILKDLIKNAEFKNRFKGIAVFFDELGFTLEKAKYSKDVLQGFMENVCQHEPNVVFVGCIHKDFKAYADRLSQDDAAVMSARITQVDLLNEGIEEIIGAIVETDKESDEWKKTVHPKVGVFDQLVPVCASLQLFEWIDDVKRIRQKVMEDIYGIHPLALACLLRLSSEIGSDNRSTFTFFSGDVGGEEGSYADFIKDTPILSSTGKLNLYTVDRLFTFFRKELNPRNPELREAQRPLVSGYQSSLEALRKSYGQDLFAEQQGEHDAILRALLILQLSRIPTTMENIQFGLYCLTRAEQKQVEKNLNYMTKAGAVFFRQQSKTYELALGAAEDPYTLIDRFLNDTNLHPPNMVEALLQEAGEGHDLEVLEAKQYNLPFSEDKRFRRRFVRAKDLGEGLWKEIRKEQEALQARDKDSVEGTVVYVLCEDEGEIAVARSAVNSIPEAAIAVAIPHQSQQFSELLLQVKACRHYLPPNEAEKISAQTESRLRDLLENAEDGFLTRLRRTFQEILAGEAACWYTKGGRIMLDRPKQPHKPADQICEELFTRRCRIKHPDLNLTHDDKWRTGKNNALKQAVTVLLAVDQEVFIDNGNPDNHGQKRYLEKVLLSGAGALKKLRSDGSINYFACETNPDKLSGDFPPLKELAQRLASLKPGDALPLGEYLDVMRKPPVGAGGTALTLALAHIVRAYGERLRAYKDSTRTVPLRLDSYDEIVKQIADPATKTVIEVLTVDAGQSALVEVVAKAVKAPPLKHGETRTVTALAAIVHQWWSQLPPATKILELYQSARRTRLKKLLDLLNGAAHADPFEWLLRRLPAIYLGEVPTGGLSKQDLETVANDLAEDVGLFNSGQIRIRNIVASAVLDIFNGQGDLVECEKVVMHWYENLNPGQRNPQKFEQEEAQHLLSRLATAGNNFEDFILRLLPKDFGLGPVLEWTSLHAQDLAAKFRQAKSLIDELKAEVPQPSIQSGVHEIQSGQTVTVEIPAGATAITYTIERDPQKGTETLTVHEPLDLFALLGGRPNVKVSIRAVDGEGNKSAPVNLEIVDKTQKYELTVAQDLLGVVKASFIFPEDPAGFIAVVRSLFKQGVRRGFLAKGVAAELEETIVKVLERKTERE